MRSATMLLQTKVEQTENQSIIHHHDPLILIGSCFAEKIGNRLLRSKFHCSVNPMGTLYNPFSIALCIKRILSKEPFTPTELHEFPGEGWGSWLHHSRYSRPTINEAIDIMNSQLEDAITILDKNCTLIITFGTAWIYRLREDDTVVGNCHRQPDNLFKRNLLSIDDIITLWSPLLEQLQATYPNLNIIFTVSPIRHLRDGAHANQLSKATLLLAIDRLLTKLDYSHFQQNHSLSYFPAYEILLDELRDYRFYADDMAHPSALAEEYIWERFCNSYMDVSTRNIITRWKEIEQALAHRPFRPNSNEYRHFIRQTLLKIETIQKEFPYFDISNEINQCHTLLNN